MSRIRSIRSGHPLDAATHETASAHDHASAVMFESGVELDTSFLIVRLHTQSPRAHPLDANLRKKCIARTLEARPRHAARLRERFTHRLADTTRQLRCHTGP